MAIASCTVLMAPVGCAVCKATAGVSGSAGAIRCSVECKYERGANIFLRSSANRSARLKDPAHTGGTCRADPQRGRTDIGKESVSLQKASARLPEFRAAGEVWNARRHETGDARPEFPEALPNPRWDRAVPSWGRAVTW